MPELALVYVDPGCMVGNVLPGVKGLLVAGGDEVSAQVRLVGHDKVERQQGPEQGHKLSRSVPGYTESCR